MSKLKEIIRSLKVAWEVYRNIGDETFVMRGKACEVTLIANSRIQGTTVTTIQARYPRFIHSQVMTHRVFSRNVSSSRAKPINWVISDIERDMASPIVWGSKKKGMQSGKELKDFSRARKVWGESARNAIQSAKAMDNIGLHKQFANRILEPYMKVDAVISSVEWDNFLNQRLSEDSQPEIQELARCIKGVLDISKAVDTKYHIPYITKSDVISLLLRLKFNLRNIFMISAARCARVSYTSPLSAKKDTKKDFELAERLMKSKHYSPFEHQVFPSTLSNTLRSNMDPTGEKGLVQFRKLVGG